MSKWILAVWSSFLVAAIAETLFFTVVDPKAFYLFGEEVTFSPLTTYSIGFFLFWLICAASSLTTLFFMRDGNQKWGVSTEPAD